MGSSHAGGVDSAPHRCLPQVASSLNFVSAEQECLCNAHRTGEDKCHMTELTCGSEKPHEMNKQTRDRPLDTGKELTVAGGEGVSSLKAGHWLR